MKMTTLCYITCNGRTLMLYRNRKENDENEGKWVGVGGKLSEGESPDECLCREVYEECGITLSEYSFRGIITFVSDEWGTEYMCLYTASVDEPFITECNEGELHWIDNGELTKLNMWEGDRIFFSLLQEERPFFSLKLIYSKDRLKGAVLDGKPLEI